MYDFKSPNLTLSFSSQRIKNARTTSRIEGSPAETTWVVVTEEVGSSLITIINPHPAITTSRAIETRAVATGTNSNRHAPHLHTAISRAVLAVIHIREEIITFPAQTHTVEEAISEMELPTTAMEAQALTEVGTLIAEVTKAIGMKVETADARETIEGPHLRGKTLTPEEMTRQ